MCCNLRVVGGHAPTSSGLLQTAANSCQTKEATATTKKAQSNLLLLMSFSFCVSGCKGASKQRTDLASKRTNTVVGPANRPTLRQSNTPTLHYLQSCCHVSRAYSAPTVPLSWLGPVVVGALSVQRTGKSINSAQKHKRLLAASSTSTCSSHCQTLSELANERTNARPNNERVSSSSDHNNNPTTSNTEATVQSNQPTLQPTNQPTTRVLMTTNNFIVYPQ